MINTYDLFTDEELEFAELIQQRRLQILVHSRIYYELNQNIISDHKWDMWARELESLQKQYPHISEKIIYADAFKDWDASTGAFLPLNDEWVVRKASQLTVKLNNPNKKSIHKNKSPLKKKKRLF